LRSSIRDGSSTSPAARTRITSCIRKIILPLAAYERGNVDEYLDALLAIHFDHLGLLYTGW
jgi:hypothetical protein